MKTSLKSIQQKIGEGKTKLAIESFEKLISHCSLTNGEKNFYLEKLLSLKSQYSIYKSSSMEGIINSVENIELNRITKGLIQLTTEMEKLIPTDLGIVAKEAKINGSYSKGDSSDADDSGEVEPKEEMVALVGHQVGENVLTKEIESTIEITINEDFNKFSKSDQEKIMAAIEKFLEMDEPIEIKKKRRGSVKLQFNLPPDKAEKLLRAIKRGEFKDLRIDDAEILREWENKGSSFDNINTGSPQEIPGSEVIQSPYHGVFRVYSNLNLGDSTGFITEEIIEISDAGTVYYKRPRIDNEDSEKTYFGSVNGMQGNNLVISVKDEEIKLVKVFFFQIKWTFLLKEMLFTGIASSSTKGRIHSRKIILEYIGEGSSTFESTIPRKYTLSSSNFDKLPPILKATIQDKPINMIRFFKEQMAYTYKELEEELNMGKVFFDSACMNVFTGEINNAVKMIERAVFHGFDRLDLFEERLTSWEKDKSIENGIKAKVLTHRTYKRIKEILRL